MIRVAHMLYSYLPVTQNWIYTQLQCNRSCDHTVISLTEENPAQFPWKFRYAAFARGSVIDRIRLPLARYWVLQPDRFLESAIGKVRPDIIHGHFAHESWRILATARRAGVPLVTTFYGLDVEKLPLRRFWKRRYPELFSCGSGFIVEGPFMGKKLAAAGCPEERIHIVSIGVDRTLFEPPRSALPFAGSDAPIRILFTGLHREKKGPIDAAIVFCEAAKSDPRLTLHCIGDGRYGPAVRRVLERQGLLDRATFHGLLTFEKYRTVLAESDIVLAPSCQAADGDCEGGAPVVCIEAQMAGKPVVATRHCDIPYVVKHGETGLLSDEHDTAALTRDLLRLAGTADLRRRMGEAGRTHALQQHDSRRQGEKIAAVYRSVLGATKDGAHD
jgi:colanic acid/amylovoran biosynthesis glycosyltransferase